MFLDLSPDNRVIFTYYIAWDGLDICSFGYCLQKLFSKNSKFIFASKSPSFEVNNDSNIELL